MMTLTAVFYLKILVSIVDDVTEPVISFCEDFGLQDSVVVDDTCLNLESTGTLSFSREWSKEEFIFFPEYDQVLMAPVVGPLYDSNEDGLISEDDIPSVAVMMDDGGQKAFKMVCYVSSLDWMEKNKYTFDKELMMILWFFPMRTVV